jgi:MFS family permease
LKWVLVAGLIADTLAMGLLAGSEPVRTGGIAYPMLLVATGALGLGFGLTLGSISTYAGAFMPARRDVALTALNVLLGLGTALSPFLIALFTNVGQWWYLPLLAAAGLTVLIAVTVIQPMELPATTGDRPANSDAAQQQIPAMFWLFAGALVIYGLGETMFGNWGTTLLVGKHVAATSANNALAAFWATVTVGRLAVALASSRIRSTYIYVVLPWAIAVALLLAPAAGSAGAGIAVFAFAGLACSGFFPMTIGYGESTFPSIVELTAGWLIAAYQLGYGLAAFGAGALQRVLSLSALFRLAAIAAVAMGLLAIVIARRQRPSLRPAAARTRQPQETNRSAVPS